MMGWACDLKEREKIRWDEWVEKDNNRWVRGEKREIKMGLGNLFILKWFLYESCEHVENSYY